MRSSSRAPSLSNTASHPDLPRKTQVKSWLHLLSHPTIQSIIKSSNFLLNPFPSFHIFQDNQTTKFSHLDHYRAINSVFGADLTCFHSAFYTVAKIIFWNQNLILSSLFLQSLNDFLLSILNLPHHLHLTQHTLQLHTLWTPAPSVTQSYKCCSLKLECFAPSYNSSLFTLLLSIHPSNPNSPSAGSFSRSP